MQCDERVYNIRRATSAVVDRACGVRRKSAVAGMSHLQCEERKCAVPGGSHLQYE